MMKVMDDFLVEQKVEEKDKKTINVDFDGVIHKYSRGYHDGTIYDVPAEGSRESLQLLKDKGYKLICFTARVNADPSGDGYNKIKQWLKKYNLLEFFDDITDKKYPSLVIIDDSALRHTSWDTTLKNLKDLGYV